MEILLWEIFMLYYLVGKSFERNQMRQDQFEIRTYLSKVQGIKHGDIRLWASRTNDLVNLKTAYSYEDWRGGNLANYHSLQ